jgi:hypothetical protein
VDQEEIGAKGRDRAGMRLRHEWDWESHS